MTLPLTQARELSRRVIERLEPFVSRIEVAGSIRRMKPEVGDIEIVAEPNLYQADLLRTLAPDIEPIHRELESMGSWTRGGNRYVRIANLFDLRSASLDLFLVHPPAQWGTIFAIRTGPAKLGKYCVSKLHELDTPERAIRCKKGHIEDKRSQEIIPTPEEEDFFELCQVPLRPPQRREDLYRQLTNRSQP